MTNERQLIQKTKEMIDGLNQFALLMDLAMLVVNIKLLQKYFYINI